MYKTIRKMRTTINELNDDCLIHLFSFCGPKEWTNFSKVCTRWHYITSRCWITNFEIYSVGKLEDNFNSPFKNQNLFDLKSITFLEVCKILKRNAPRLKKVTLLWIHWQSVLICCFGNNYYKLTESFNPVQLLQILSDESCNINSLEALCFEPEDRLLWTKIIKNNRNLISFKLHYIGSSFHDDSCLDSKQLVCNHDNFIKNILLGLPSTLKNIYLDFWQYPFPPSWQQIVDKQSHLKMRIESSQHTIKRGMLLKKYKVLDALYLESCNSSLKSLKISQKFYLDKLRMEILLVKDTNLSKIMSNIVQTLLTLE